MTVTTKKPKSPAAPTPYESDFYTWLNEQAALLRAHAFNELDIENLAEEIEDLGREQFNKLVSAYRIILLHMLKWDYQPSHRTRSWESSIRVQRLRVATVLEDNPGLKSRRAKAVARAYDEARIQAATEMNRPDDDLPETCPYSFDEISNRKISTPT